MPHKAPAPVQARALQTCKYLSNTSIRLVIDSNILSLAFAPPPRAAVTSSHGPSNSASSNGTPQNFSHGPHTNQNFAFQGPPQSTSPPAFSPPPQSEYPPEKVTYQEQNAAAFNQNASIARPISPAVQQPAQMTKIPGGAPAHGAFKGATATNEDNVGTFNGGSYRVSHRDSNSLLIIQLAIGAPLTAKPGMSISLSKTEKKYAC